MSEQVPKHSSSNDAPAVSARLQDQDRTLRALHHLERAVAAPLGIDRVGRHHTVLAALTGLEDAMVDEQVNANRPDSLLSGIAHMQPRLRSRVHGTRAHYQQLRETVAELARDLGSGEVLDVDPDDLRRRVARLASALRYQRARESDLIYEAYYDTFGTDIESGLRDTESPQS